MTPHPSSAPQRIYASLGTMSGTSLDGLDLAFIRTDGEAHIEAVAAESFPYDDAAREILRAALGAAAESPEAEAAAKVITEAHIAAIKSFGEKPDLIGFHGQTILHRPEERLTVQIGDAAALARAVGCDVIGDFRRADVEAGGQGAPLAPLFHAALAATLPKPLAVVNIGGVANATYHGASGEMLAFDTGAGNALLDDWAYRHTGTACDTDGALARAGAVDAACLARLLDHPYFAAPPPKSLDRLEFDAQIVEGLSPADGAATLTAFTAAGIAAAVAHFPAAPRRFILCGGGRHNPALCDALTESLAAPVENCDTLGWHGDALEAQAFAWLAVRSLRGLPLSLPETTGVPKPMTGGRLYKSV